MIREVKQQSKAMEKDFSPKLPQAESRVKIKPVGLPLEIHANAPMAWCVLACHSSWQSLLDKYTLQD